MLLTDAEIDHTLGLVLLREGRGVSLHATAATADPTARHPAGGLRLCPPWSGSAGDVDRGRPGDGPRPRRPGLRAFEAPTGKHDRFASPAQRRRSGHRLPPRACPGASSGTGSPTPRPAGTPCTCPVSRS
ncbi:hypothetical protein [Pseudonocardia sp. ICBG601]|uniref:hypothetical protein n=1 Tax=Pseudonocardia sp. ICBG601 TaxID=2846759 RepID=UPI0027E29987|nr:hypothetical protein [Pseudonocardia sp. ICBG601]